MLYLGSSFYNLVGFGSARHKSLPGIRQRIVADGFCGGVAGRLSRKTGFRYIFYN
jgi:hypothetical protein